MVALVLEMDQVYYRITTVLPLVYGPLGLMGPYGWVH